MTEDELHQTLSLNIKKYRKGKFTQEQLAEKIGVSTQNINDIEGKRRWPRESTLVKIADALEIEVYQLFVPPNFKSPVIEGLPETKDIRIKMQAELHAKFVEFFRKSMNKILDEWESKYKTDTSL